MLVRLIDDAVTGAAAHANRVVTPLARAGVGTPLLPVGGGVVLLETTGHRSGLTREVPLLATRSGRTVRVSTVRGDSHWVRNVEANPDVAVWYGGRRHPVTARVRRSDSVTTVTLRPRVPADDTSTGNGATRREPTAA